MARFTVGGIAIMLQTGLAMAVGLEPYIARVKVESDHLYTTPSAEKGGEVSPGVEPEPVASKALVLPLHHETKKVASPLMSRPLSKRSGISEVHREKVCRQEVGETWFQQKK